MSQEKKTIEISDSDISSDYSSDDLIKPQKVMMTKEQEKFWEERAIYIRMLFMSARDGDFEMVKYLVEKKKIDPDSTCDDYDVPLHFAIKNKHNDIAKYLIERGAGINDVNPSNNGPLYFAYYSRNNEMLEYLLNKKDINTLIQSDDFYFEFDGELGKKLNEIAIKLMKENLAKYKN